MSIAMVAPWGLRILEYVETEQIIQNKLRMNQQDFDEVVKRLPSPAKVETDRYIAYSPNTTCRFIFRKEVFFITPQRVTLTMWVLDNIDKL